jgi:hypothetical protein
MDLPKAERDSNAPTGMREERSIRTYQLVRSLAGQYPGFVRTAFVQARSEPTTCSVCTKEVAQFSGPKDTSCAGPGTQFAHTYGGDQVLSGF